LNSDLDHHKGIYTFTLSYIAIRHHQSRLCCDWRFVSRPSSLTQPRPNTILQLASEIQLRTRFLASLIHCRLECIRVPEASQTAISPLVPRVALFLDSTDSIQQAFQILLAGVALQEGIPSHGVGLQALASHVRQDLLGESELAVRREAFQEDGPGLDVRYDGFGRGLGGCTLHVLDDFCRVDERALVLGESAEESVVAVRSHGSRSEGLFTAVHELAVALVDGCRTSNGALAIVYELEVGSQHNANGLDWNTLDPPCIGYTLGRSWYR